jgi:hypothetical protein
MKTRSLILAAILLGISFTGSRCAKTGGNDDGSSNGGGSNIYTEPVLKPEDTWVYMTMTTPLEAADNNNRPVDRKWIATKVTTSVSVPHISGDTTKNYLGFVFENTDKYSRFLTDTVNPGGKEVMDIALNEFNRAPGPGNYTMDIDYKQGFCFFDVYKANGDKRDSSRHQSFTPSSFNVTSMTLFSSGGGVTYYKMTGTASIEILYFPTGASSSSDVHNLQVTFNNVPIQILK